MPKSESQSSLLALGLLAASLGAQAQTPPDAGSLRRQIEQEKQQVMPGRKGGELSKPGTAEAQPGAMRVLVRGFTFTGNRLLSESELQAVTAPWVGKSLDVAALQAVAAAVGQAYRDRGWVVRSLLPRQEVKDGVVRIEVVEALFGKMGVDGTPAGRVPPAQVQAFAGDRLHAGQAVNAKDLDRGLLLADDLPGVAVSGRLRPGGSANLYVEPTEHIVGKAAVCVPQEVSRREAGFSFPLPRGLANTVKADREAIVTTPAGEALPRWLRYDAARRVIVVSTVRAGALPLQVLVTIRGQKTLLTIAEKSNPGTGRR